MLLPRLSSPQHNHPCLSPTYTRSVFEGRFELLRPSTQGTPLFTTHREGLLIWVGSLLCVPTYNRGMVQHVVFDRFGLAPQPHEYSSKTATCKANRSVQAASNSTSMYRGRNCCTTHVVKAAHVCSRNTIVSSSSSNPRTTTD